MFFFNQDHGAEIPPVLLQLLPKPGEGPNPNTLEPLRVGAHPRTNSLRAIARSLRSCGPRRLSHVNRPTDHQSELDSLL